METMQPALKNGRNVWDRVNMPKASLKGVVERIRAEIKEAAWTCFFSVGKTIKNMRSCYVSNL